MTSVIDQTAEDARQAFASGESSPSEILEQTLERLDQLNPVLNAIAYLDVDGARSAAEAADARWRAGQPLSAFDGLPVSIKDSVNAVGMPWRHGCAANDGLPMATFDSPPAARLKDAGAVIIGKTTMPDFGMMAAGVSSLYGVVRNPWDTSRNTGGSSAGAGASIAAGIGFGSIGTDIAGSVRLPAGHCGITALKPTQGRVPHLVPSMTRSAGPMARTVAELTELFDIVGAVDARDFWSLPVQAPRSIPSSPTGLRVGVLTDLGYGTEVDPAVLRVVDAAAQALAAAGAEVSTMAPLFDGGDPYEPLDRIFQVRALTELESHAPERRHLVHPAIRDWCAAADKYTAADGYRDADLVAQSAAHVHSVTTQYDLVLSPVIPVVGFPAEAVGVDPTQPLGHCGFTAWFNQTTQPAATVPFGFESGLPIGVQIAGHRFADRTVLAAAGWLEEARGFTMPLPGVIAKGNAA